MVVVISFSVIMGAKAAADSQSHAMDVLKKFISERLAAKAFCTVFKQELNRVWPLDEHEAQKKAIAAFAKANGWTVKFSDPGVRAVFRKADAPSESFSLKVPASPTAKAIDSVRAMARARSKNPLRE